MRLRLALDRLFRREHLDHSMEEEIRFHIDERARDLERAGLPAEEAGRRARIEFGGIESYKEQCREAWRFHALHEFLADLRFGLRMLRRNPGFSILAILCLTVGIGANAAVCSWIEGVLLRPFPAVAHQERLMAVSGTKNGLAGAVGSNLDLSWPDFHDLATNSTLFDAFIVDRIMGSTLGTGNRAQWTTGSIVSSNYFDALGVRPILGRGFEPQEDVGRNAHPVTVISYRLWKDRFSGDPDALGRTQVLNNVPHTIIGIAPQGFSGTFVGWTIDFWVPLSMQEIFNPPYKLEDRGDGFIEGFARLKPGVTAAQAQAEVTAITRRLEEEYPATNRGRGAKLFPLWQTPFNNAGTLLPTLGIALSVVVSVLLIVCANVGNLLLVRGLARRHEMTLRLAVGARRSRLVRQLLTESFLFAIFATAGGLLLANWCRDLLVVLLPSHGDTAMNLPGTLDWRVLTLSLGVCVLSTLLIALIPAVQTSNVDLAGILRAESSGVVSERRQGRIRSVLITLQVALSFVLLVGSGLLLKSLRTMQSADPGFSLDRELTSYVDFAAAGYDRERAHAFHDRLIDRLQALPGLESASFARVIPFGYVGYPSAPIAVDGMTVPATELPTIDFNEVGPAYLVTMGIPLVSGREFTRADNETAPLVAVVNQAMAAAFWPGQDPVGLRIQVKGRWMRVVGVAGNAKYRRIDETTAPFFYVPLRQAEARGTALQIRTTQAPQALAQSLIHEIHALDANLGLGEVITMREQFERSMAPQRVGLLISALFAGMALALATIGLYGVMAYTVSQSKRELGLRMALGARPSDLLRLVMSHGLMLTAGGVVLGAAAALGLTRLLGYLLYKVSPRDPLTFGAAFLVTIIAASAACFLPAWRATRTDPLQALRG